MDQVCEITPLFIDFLGIYQLRLTLSPFLPSQFAPLNPLLHLSKAVMKKVMVLLITLVLTQMALMLVSQSIFFFHTQPSRTVSPLQLKPSSLSFLPRAPSEPPLFPFLYSSFTSHLFLSVVLLTPSLCLQTTDRWGPSKPIS